MADREKVISGIECCLEGLCDCCFYKNSDGPGGCKDELMVDALALLKEQEPRVMIDLQKLLSDFVHRVNNMTNEELYASYEQAKQDSQDSYLYD